MWKSCGSGCASAALASEGAGPRCSAVTGIGATQASNFNCLAWLIELAGAPGATGGEGVNGEGIIRLLGSTATLLLLLAALALALALIIVSSSGLVGVGYTVGLGSMWFKALVR
jgi:hypothetical protein